MRQSYLALTKVFCIAAAALAAPACVVDEGPSSTPDPDAASHDTGALLRGVDGATPPGQNASVDTTSGCQLPAGARTLHQQKGPLEDLPVACVPAWTPEQLGAGFAAIRDERLLTTAERPDFPRRIPWLDPDNGCEERAAAATYFLDQRGYPAPFYVRAVRKDKASPFVLRTDNDPNGQVTWSHHVAPAVRVHGQVMILDPALDPTQPLPVAAWLSLFAVPGQFDVALCRDHAVGDGCFDAAPPPPPPPDLRPGMGIHRRLETEWRVQELLGRDPLRSLGACPPWVTCAEPEPTPDPSRPPVIRKFESDRFGSPVWTPIYVIGDNFDEATTTVRITGSGVDELAPIDAINLRRILITKVYDPGDYQVTASNGNRAGQPVLLRIE